MAYDHCYYYLLHLYLYINKVLLKTKVILLFIWLSLFTLLNIYDTTN